MSTQETAESNATGSGGPDRKIWIDGEFRAWADATIHVLSHSVQRGSLVFDYLSLHSGSDTGFDDDEGSPPVFIFRLREHVERFRRSCEMMGLLLVQSQAELETAICETVRANPGSRVVKISAYLASVEVDVVPLNTHVTVAIAAYDPLADVLQRSPRPSLRPPKSLKLWLEKERANRRDDILSPQTKVAANYASPMTAKLRAREEGYDEILLVDQDENLAEGPTTNFFLVTSAGDLLTPTPDRVLHGVTRSSVIELAKAEGIPFRETAIKPEELWTASEAFLTGTSAGVWPVESVDRREIGTRCPGPITTRLRDRFLRASNGDDPEFEHWLTRVVN